MEIDLGPIEVFENDDGSVGFVIPGVFLTPGTPAGGSFNPNVTLAFLEGLDGAGPQPLDSPEPPKKPPI